MNIENKSETITEIRMNKKDRKAFFDEYLKLEKDVKRTDVYPRTRYPTIYEIWSFINGKGV